ncbi:Tyrosine--tRNA ligase [compost metagenome]
MLSPFDFWQFWRNTSDADLQRFLAIFTELPVSEIEHIDFTDIEAVNEMKKLLADMVTSIVHGSPAACDARRKADQLFGGVVDEVTHRVALADVRNVPDLLVAIAFAPSKSEGRRLMAGNGVKIGDLVVTDEKAPFAAAVGDRVLVSVGKKRRALVEII